MPPSARTKASYASVVSRGSSPQPSEDEQSLSKDVIVVSSREPTPTPSVPKKKSAASSKSKTVKSKQQQPAKPTAKTSKKATVKKEPEDDVLPLDSKVSAPEATPSRASASEATASKATVSKSTASKATASKATASKATASKATASKATASKATAPKATASKARTKTSTPVEDNTTESKAASASKKTSRTASKRSKPLNTDEASNSTVPAVPVVLAGDTDKESSDLDAGALPDPADTMYRASTAKNRVQPSPTRSSARVRKSNASRPTKTVTDAADDESALSSVPSTPTKTSLDVSQITDGGSAKRSRSSTNGNDSDGGSVSVQAPRTKRIKVAVPSDGDSDSVPDDVDMVDGTADSEAGDQSGVDENSGDDIDSQNEEDMDTDDDAGFIDDTALESDHSSTRSSQEGSNSEAEEDSVPEQSRSPSPEPPTSAQPPMRASFDDGEQVKDGPSASQHSQVTHSAATNNKRQAGDGAGQTKRMKARRTFGSVIVKKSVDEPRLGDLEYTSIKTLPSTCGVTNPQLQDPELKKTYVDRPNLQPGQFNPWNDAKGRQMMMFSFWVDCCPDMDYENALNAIEFVQWNRYINISQMSPCDVLVRKIPGVSNTFHLYTTKRKPAMCISLVSCIESCIYKFPSSGIKHKRVSVRFHSQEWERAVAFTCMVFQQQALEAQLSGGVLQISTRFVPSSQPAGDANTTPSKPSRYATVNSPAIGTSTASSYGAPKHDPFTLEATDDIRVYDAREVEFNLKTDLDKIDTLPAWCEGEIPDDSCIAVAYTLSSYQGKRGPTASFNLHWIIVFGTPKWSR